jgi:hypothetical protein
VANRAIGLPIYHISDFIGNRRELEDNKSIPVGLRAGKKENHQKIIPLTHNRGHEQETGTG